MVREFEGEGVRKREKKVDIYKAISLLPCLGVTAKCYII